MLPYIKLYAACILLFAGAFANAQPAAQQFQTDTLHLTLAHAEEMFLRNNFQLLAQRYNIDAVKAQEIQTRLFPNPNFSITHGLYQTQSKQILPFGSAGETSSELDQLIYLAGKRNKQIKIAEANTKLAEYQFYDLARTLKYTLRTDFFNIYYQQASAKLYNQEISSLQLVVKAFDEQEGKGYISEKEVVRIKAQLFSLQNEYNVLINQVNDVESEIRLVLQTPKSYIDPVLDPNVIQSQSPLAYPLATLIDSAYNNRTDLQIAKQNTGISKLNYTYQKALATPDITLSAGYDQQGSYIKNYNFIGASISLPFFNRNQGNIKSAKINIDVSNALQKETEATVEEQVYRSLQRAIDNNRLFNEIDPAFSKNFETLMQQVLINYQKRNITLLDFLDFYDSYKQNILQQNAARFNTVSALEDINYYTGTNFYN